jgi:hypothetical protein
MLLRIPFAGLASRDDNQAVQTDDRDKGACQEEMQEDSEAGVRLQPDHPNVVRPHPRIPPANPFASKNVSNILRFARRQHIPQPEQLTMEELKDGLQLAHI